MKTLLLIFLMSLSIPLRINATICSCTTSSPFASATINTGGLVVTITTCSFGGEYSTISGAVSGQTLNFTSSVGTDYITIHEGSPSGPIKTCGTTPLSFANTYTGTLYAHWNTNSACGTQTSCRTTTVQCTSCASAPEMNVQGNSNNIADNTATTPSTTNWTDFGSVLACTGTISRTFTIQNTGTATLNLSGTPRVAISGTGSGDFTITQPSVSTVSGPSGSTTFSVLFDPSAVVTRTCTLSIANDDADENPFEFRISGTGTADVTAPGITCPGKQTIYLDGACNGTLGNYTGMASTSDNCPGSITVTQSPAISSTVSGVGTTTVTLTATDGSGNSATCSFSVNRNDNTPPGISCPGTQTFVLNSNCEVSLPDYTSLPSTSDNCSGVTVTQSPAISSYISGVGTTTVYLYATDASGNSSSCWFSVDRVDNSGPSAYCQNITRTISVSGTTSITVGMIDDGSYDGCTSIGRTASKTVFGCADLGTNFVTLTVTDGYGNSSTCIAEVNIVDELYPTAVCKDITVYLDSTGNATITGNMIDGGSTDNCSIVTWTASPSAFTAADLGANTVVLTVTDFSSNSSTCTATVTVEEMITSSDQSTIGNGWDVQLFPNPNAGVFTLTFTGANSDDCRIEVWSVEGRKVLEQSQGRVSGSRNIEMNIVNQAKGIYFVKVWMGETQVVKKMVVQ